MAVPDRGRPGAPRRRGAACGAARPSMPARRAPRPPPRRHPSRAAARRARRREAAAEVPAAEAAAAEEAPKPERRTRKKAEHRGGRSRGPPPRRPPSRAGARRARRPSRGPRPRRPPGRPPAEEAPEAAPTHDAKKAEPGPRRSGARGSRAGRRGRAPPQDTRPAAGRRRSRHGLDAVDEGPRGRSRTRPARDPALRHSTRSPRAPSMSVTSSPSAWPERAGLHLVGRVVDLLPRPRRRRASGSRSCAQREPPAGSVPAWSRRRPSE